MWTGRCRLHKFNLFVCCATLRQAVLCSHLICYVVLCQILSCCTMFHCSVVAALHCVVFVIGVLLCLGSAQHPDDVQFFADLCG